MTQAISLQAHTFLKQHTYAIAAEVFLQFFVRPKAQHQKLKGMRMAHRYWKLKENMGYAGTDSEEEIDLVEVWGNTEKEIEEMPESEVQDQLNKEAWEQAIEKVDAYAEPMEKPGQS